MNPPNEGAITEAIRAISEVKSVDDLAATSEALAAAMGLERYMIVDVRSGLIGGVYHNAPPLLAADAGSLERISDDAIAERGRSSLRPFAWQCQDGTWRHKGADLGYRSGVSCGAWGSAGSGCIAMFSGSAPSVPTKHLTTLLTYTVSAAMYLAASLRQLPLQPRFECPFTKRELDCLLYALAGFSAKKTARALGVSTRTVDEYLARARFRLGVSNSYAAATSAMKRGWLDVQKAAELADSVSAAGAGKIGGIDEAEQREDELKHRGLR